MEQRQAHKRASKTLVEHLAFVAETMLNKLPEDYQGETATIYLTIVIFEPDNENNHFSEGDLRHTAEIKQQNAEYYPSFMNNERDLREELEHLAQLWRIHKERQRSLETTAAMRGIDTDPSTRMQIDSIKREITKIDEQGREIFRKLERLSMFQYKEL